MLLAIARISGTLMTLLVVLTTLWVYLDATDHKIGKQEGSKAFFNMSAGAWASFTLLLWIVGFPSYLIKRSSLIATATANPVGVENRGGKITAFAVIGGIWFLISLVVSLSGVDVALPGCDTADTTGLLKSIALKTPSLLPDDAQFVGIQGAVEKNFDDANQVRTCQASLVTSAGSREIHYTIVWKNRVRALFYVKITN